MIDRNSPALVFGPDARSTHTPPRLDCVDRGAICRHCGRIAFGVNRVRGDPERFRRGGIVDALAVRGRLAGLGVSMPELVRLQKDRPGVIETRILNDPMNARPLRIGLPFPPEIASKEDDRAILLPAGAGWSRLDWACTPMKRGQYFLEHAYLEAASPLGFWGARATVPSAPSCACIRIFLRSGRTSPPVFKRGALGAHTQRQAGQGREFEKLRDYLHGDSIHDIHWKASAKRGQPVTKVFQIERTQEVYVIVDASRLTREEAFQVSSFRFQVLSGSHVPSRGSSDQPET